MTSSLIVLAPALLALSLFVETSSWWVRALSPNGSIGLYVSRSNIYLYGGRFFALAFTSVGAIWIESGATPDNIAQLVAVSLLIAVAFQALLLRSIIICNLMMRLIAFGLRLPRPQPISAPTGRTISKRLVLATAAASAIFGIGLGAPLLAAVLVPEYRLSVSYVGQIINSLGTLVILFLVDQMLFRSLDAGTLQQDVRDYSLGRLAGFTAAGVIFAISTFFV